MPVTPTYPGVYIEEIPSGVRTITGVATSITAFVGRALRGPVDEPVTINNNGDFERIFGGLWKESRLGFAVKDFYLNGGAQAIIVRVHNGAQPAEIELSTDVTLAAKHPGEWGNGLRVRVDHDVSEEVAESFGLTKSDLFNLAVHDKLTGVTELHRNLTVKESPRRIDNVLQGQSQLAVVKGDVPDTAAVPDKHGDPPAGKGPFDDDAIGAHTKATDDSGDDGAALNSDSFVKSGFEAEKKGLYALKDADLFNILCLPPYKATGGENDRDIDTSLIASATKLCVEERAFLLIDPPSSWTDKDTAKAGIASGAGDPSQNAAIYFPRLKQPNPLKDNQIEEFVPCGAVAGVFTRTDAQRGVWKAPAGLAATLNGVPQLSVPLTDAENGELNPLGINCLRSLPPAGRVVWGARTRVGDDRLASEWKYVPVRRLALFIEESLYRGTQWAVFEPNDEPLWAQLRLNIGAFMQNLFRQGAFQGQSPKDAYFVKADSETTTQNDINLGIVNIVVGFAPLKPAEFVIIKIQQMAGQVEA